MDSTTIIEQVDSSQAAHEVTVNSLFDAASIAMAYGRHAEACAGLTWGYYGVRYGGTAIANGTEALVDDETNYMVVNMLTGAVFFDVENSSNSLWDDTDTYGHAYSMVTVGGVVVSYQDHRFGPNGIFGGAAGGGGSTVIDGGQPTSTYGAITPIEGGTP